MVSETLVLCSDYSVYNTNPDHKTSFSIPLQKPISISNTSKFYACVKLIVCQITNRNLHNRPFFVLSSTLCNPQPVGNKILPILTTFAVNSGGIIEQPQRMVVEIPPQNATSFLHFSITDHTGKELPISTFRDELITITLQISNDVNVF